jgi:hypothetical protein
VALGEEVVVV